MQVFKKNCNNQNKIKKRNIFEGITFRVKVSQLNTFCTYDFFFENMLICRRRKQIFITAE